MTVCIAQTAIRHPPSAIRHRAGFSLVELLVSLAITAMLLTATMVAIDASFKAYAASVETASAQTATRMVVNRLLMMIRNSGGEQGPVRADSESPLPTGRPDADWPVTLDTDHNNTLDSDYIEMINSKGAWMRIQYEKGADGKPGKLVLVIDGNDNFEYDATADPKHLLLTGVEKCHFSIHRRKDDDTGVWVLDRATIDLTVKPDTDNTLAIEGDRHGEIHVVASTMPRKLE